MILYLLMITTKDLSWSLKLKSKMVSLKRSWRPERRDDDENIGDNDDSRLEEDADKDRKEDDERLV